MPPIRFRMNRLMGWVAVIALNLAAWRVLFVGPDLVVPLVMVIQGGLLQFAAYRSIRGAGRSRRFWIGFASSGTIATLSFLRAARSEGSIPARFWVPYYRELHGFLEQSESLLTRLLGNVGWELGFVALLAVGCIVPIVFLAGAVGLFSRWLVAGPARQPEPSAGPPAL